MCITQKLNLAYRDYREYNSTMSRILNILIFPFFMFSSFCLLNYIPLQFDFSTYRGDIPRQVPDCALVLRSNSVLFILYLIYNVCLSPCYGSIFTIFNLGLLALSNVYFCKYDMGYIYMIIANSLVYLYIFLCSNICFRRRNDNYTKGQNVLYRLFRNILIGPLCSMIDILVKLGCASGITIYKDIIIDAEEYSEIDNNIKYTKEEQHFSNHYSAI